MATSSPLAAPVTRDAPPSGIQAASLPAVRSILIDALNVAYWCGQPPSLRLPMAAMAHLRARGFQVSLYFDASARHQLQTEHQLYAALLREFAGIIEAPSGRSADQLLLKHARASGACILSRDRYRDHRRRYRKLIDDPARLLTGWVHADRLLIPALALDEPLPASAPAAWAELQAAALTLSGPDIRDLGW